VKGISGDRASGFNAADMKHAMELATGEDEGHAARGLAAPWPFRSSLVGLTLALASACGGDGGASAPSTTSIFPATGVSEVGTGAAGVAGATGGAAGSSSQSGAAGGAPATVPERPESPVVPVGPVQQPEATRWVGAWATGPQLTEPNNMPPAPGLSGNTLRQYVFPTLSGGRARLLLSNEFGNGPVTFGSVHLATAGAGGAIDASTDRTLSFEGSPSLTIEVGESRFSDPIDFEVAALRPVAVSAEITTAPSGVTGHPGSRTTSFLANGNAAAAASLPGSASTDHWYYITGLDVEGAAPSAAVVTLGDSITDGRGSTTNANNRWPDALARRLQANSATAHISVLNQGIGGNAVVNGGLGPTAIARFERDVLEQRGARWVIVLEGVNDIGYSADATIADRLIQAYEGFIESAHGRGLSIYGATILPFGGSSYDSPAHEAARSAVNEWVRTSGRFDAVIDLEAAVADPANPTRLQQAYDSGDQLHLSPAGYQAMADAVDLRLFQP
jgi:lysophospholipase L1-like esterase